MSVAWVHQSNFALNRYSSPPLSPYSQKKLDQLVLKWLEALSMGESAVSASDPEATLFSPSQSFQPLSEENLGKLHEYFPQSNESVHRPTRFLKTDEMSAPHTLGETIPPNDWPIEPVHSPKGSQKSKQMSVPHTIEETIPSQKDQSPFISEKRLMDECTDIAMQGDCDKALQITNSIELTTTFKHPLQILCMKLKKNKRQDIAQKIIALIQNERLKEKIETWVYGDWIDYENW